MKLLIIFLLSITACSAQDVTASLEQLNKIRKENHLPAMKYAPHMQKSCDQFAKVLSVSFEHSPGNDFNECIAEYTKGDDPILAFRSSPEHWAILMSHWDNNICVGTYEANNKVYVVVRTF